MGHTRLGQIPKGHKWEDIVSTLAETSTIPEEIQLIAQKTLDAAEAGIEKAIDDMGLRYAFYILTQITLSARQEDWEQSLSKHNIDLSNVDSTIDFLSEIQLSIDDYIEENGRATDISEMAQQAVGESLAILIEAKAQTLFGTGKEEIKSAVKHLSTKKGFSDVGQKFFGHFMTHYLNFYLSRITASTAGSDRFEKVSDISRFNKALQTHCEQTARIVRTFCGEWYSKTEYLEGIDIENTSKFMSVALKKLKSEIREQKIEK